MNGYPLIHCGGDIGWSWHPVTAELGAGHFHGALTGHDLMTGTDNRHSRSGADWLSQWFGPAVTEPIRLHVAAKRYLCAVEPDYFARLSPASVYTLQVQGGPMTPDQAQEFEDEPHHADAIALRRWDDAAKDPTAPTPPFDHFRPLLEHLVEIRTSSNDTPAGHTPHGGDNQS